MPAQFSAPYCCVLRIIYPSTLCRVDFLNALSKSGWRNLKPESCSFRLEARTPDNNISEAICPYNIFNNQAGKGKSSGRPETRARVCINCAFVTGSGATILTGPSNTGQLRVCSIAETRSSRLIQLIYCRPLPNRRINPQGEVARMRCSAPPWGVRPIPNRIKTVRIPASLAGFVPFSQSLQTSEMKSFPGGAVSSIRLSRQSP